MKRSSRTQSLMPSGILDQFADLPDELLAQIFAHAPKQHPALRLSCKRFASIVSRQLTLFRFAPDSTAWQSKLDGAGRRQHKAQMQLMPDHFPNVEELEVRCPELQTYSSCGAINYFLLKIAMRWRLRTIRLLGEAAYKGYADIGNQVLPKLVANFPALAHVRIGLHAKKETMQLLSQLTSLEALEVHFARSSSSIIAEVWPAALLQLRSLSLSFTFIDALTATSPIFTMTRLCSLALENVCLVNPEVVQACQLLSSLRCLELAGPIGFPHAEMLSCIAAVTQLSELRLRNFDVDSRYPDSAQVWRALGNMPHLQSLDIYVQNEGAPTSSPLGFSQLTSLTLRLRTPPMPAVPRNIRVLNIYSPAVLLADMHVAAELQGLPHLQALAVHSDVSFRHGHDLKQDVIELAAILQSTGLPRLLFSSRWPLDVLQAKVDAHFAADGQNGKVIIAVPSPPPWGWNLFRFYEVHAV